MEPLQTLSVISGKKEGQFKMTEIAGAIINPLWALCDLGTLFMQGDLKKIGEGDPASNLRFKNDTETNNVVVANFMNLFKNYHESQKKSPQKEPIVVTSIPRSQRYITYSFNEDGTIQAFHGASKDILPLETDRIQKFLEYMKITKENLATMRESTKGSRYCTYMADLISFVFMINYYYHTEMFECVRMEAVYAAHGSLKEFVQGNGQTWKPRVGQDYLYFQDVDGKYDSDYTNDFLVPKEGVISKVYSQISELLSLEENGFKAMVRKHFAEVREFSRVSDYWLNDVDDAFTIYMFYNCYCHTELTEDETKIKIQIKEIIESFS